MVLFREAEPFSPGHDFIVHEHTELTKRAFGLSHLDTEFLFEDFRHTGGFVFGGHSGFTMPNHYRFHSFELLVVESLLLTTNPIGFTACCSVRRNSAFADAAVQARKAALLLGVI